MISNDKLTSRIGGVISEFELTVDVTASSLTLFSRLECANINNYVRIIIVHQSSSALVLGVSEINTIILKLKFFLFALLVLSYYLLLASMSLSKSIFNSLTVRADKFFRVFEFDSSINVL